MYKVVLLRHGESTWNKENRFTGWTDVDLTDKGREEALNAGRLLKQDGFSFDLAFTSVLIRAIRTCWITLDELGERVPVMQHHAQRLPVERQGVDAPAFRGDRCREGEI